ncbi:isoprenylcysteine carboxylmethyltransferase family protein [Brevibacillus laterosporus]|uniref:Isoprenylcysteine carboxylmethyltransferase family protein n=1 Tax=Brevibacillus laterosporus TaxID=1465 RepID=A0A518V9Q3_BRELA|nr:isoprenylcysteine carboxylmethyltransferase family protein [Brevibacillus laterosporus]
MINVKILTAQIVGMFVVFALAMFLSAGTVAWLAGWAYLFLFFGFVFALSVWLIKYNPDLLTERMTGIGKPDQKAWDKVWYVLMNVYFLAWLVFMPLDAVRFRWSHVPMGLQVAGAILLLCSFYFFFLVFRENSYLSPAVRIQSERKQTVISTGPYKVVRHPMYATAIIYLIGTCLLLGSWYGLLTVLVIVIGMAWRAVQEERTLLSELPGYNEYMSKVKYRLIPYIW